MIPRHAYVVGVALLLALWLALGLSCVSSPAGASTYAYAHQHEAAPVAQELAADALPFFAARGVVGCPDGVDVEQAPSLVDGDGVDAWERGMSCEVWLSDDLVDAVLYSDTFDSIARACQAIYHGVGHALGLPHSRAGLMAGPLADGTPPLAEPYPYAWTPSPCLRWARSWYAASLRGDDWSEWSISSFLRYVDGRLRRHEKA